jgi:hypothetical protein
MRDLRTTTKRHFKVLVAHAHHVVIGVNAKSSASCLHRRSALQLDLRHKLTRVTIEYVIGGLGAR